MARRILVAVLAVVLTILHAVPWIPGQHQPIIFGIFPITMVMWIVWTLAVMATLTWVAYSYDPYRPVVDEFDRRAADSAALRPDTGASREGR